ncbi:MAG: inositol monophosphatase family protein [Thermoanaerobaculia bacterium]
MNRERLDIAIAAAEAGAVILKDFFRTRPLEPAEKARNDFVTIADRQSESAVLAEIRRRFPEDRILAEEEGFSGDADSEYCWYIDPLDGTANFMQGLPVFCVSVGCSYRGELIAAAIVDPEGENLFTATRAGGAQWNGRPMEVASRAGLQGAFLATGFPFHAHRALDVYLKVFRDVFMRARSIRRCGSAALDLAYTAAGVYEGFFEFRLSPWDLAAGMLLVREAGGAVSDLSGGAQSLESGNVIAGPPGVHRELLRIVQQYVDEAGLEQIDPGRSGLAGEDSGSNPSRGESP